MVSLLHRATINNCAAFDYAGGKSRPTPLCVRFGPSFPTVRGTAVPPLFGPCLMWPSGRPRLLSSCFYILFTVVPIFVAVQLYVV